MFVMIIGTFSSIASAAILNIYGFRVCFGMAALFLAFASLMLVPKAFTKSEEATYFRKDNSCISPK